MTSDIDWKIFGTRQLRHLLTPYSPYSDSPVGAAGWYDDHRMVGRLHVENVLIWPRSLCRVCCVCSLHSSGGGRLIALSCVTRRRGVDAVWSVFGGADGAGVPGLLIDHPLGPRPFRAAAATRSVRSIVARERGLLYEETP